MDRNGGGNLALAVAGDAELLQRAQEAGADPLGDLAAAGEALDGGWQIDDATQDDGARVVTLATTFDDPAELEALSAELTEALSAEEVVLLEELEVAVTDDRVEVSGAAGAALRPTVREYGLSPRRAERLLAKNDAFVYRVSVDPPGDVVAAEPALEDPAATSMWTISPGETLEFSLASTRPGSPVIPALVGSVLGLAVAWVVLRVVIARRNASRRRRRVSAG